MLPFPIVAGGVAIFLCAAGVAAMGSVMGMLVTIEPRIARGDA